ncbi:hypothetical protein [Streptomyces griseorubiginosus]|uniref:hypothetical protein n=1 Tax=Streptomyces griseorubiginosus TaxID=67304 RepID=UPI0036ED47E9
MDPDGLGGGGMNARLVNTVADVINAALTQNRTAAGIAMALESAQLLQSPETAAEVQRLRDENELLRLNHTQIQASLTRMSAELGQALRDAAEDLPLLRANLQGWSERSRKAEAELRLARIELAELEARAAAGLGAVWWLAQYEGVEPELFATEAAAREFCDQQAVGELDGWDWFPDGDGVFRQWRTSDLDDRPVGEGPGSVTRLLAPAQGPRLDEVTEAGGNS